MYASMFCFFFKLCKNILHSSVYFFYKILNVQKKHCKIAMLVY